MAEPVCVQVYTNPPPRICRYTVMASLGVARSKGLSPLKVITRHALKNALIPVITVMAIQISSLLSGAVITESVFAIPGVGSLAVSAINNRDMPLLQGTVIFTALLIIAGNLVADILYSVIDPRIRVD